MEFLETIFQNFLLQLEGVIENKIKDIIGDKQTIKEDTPELLTRKQVAELLKVSIGTVDNLSKQGVLNKHYLGRCPRFSRYEVIQMLEEGWKKYQTAKTSI